MHSVLAHSIKTGLEEMGDSGRAETEQALYGYTSRENESKTGLLTTMPPPDHLGEEGKK